MYQTKLPKEFSPYYWEITWAMDGLKNEIGFNSHGLTDIELDKVDHYHFEPFIMEDCDGEVYYRGKIAGEFDGFEPLDDFGMPNAGCTDIKYWDEKNGYTTL